MKLLVINPNTSAATNARIRAAATATAAGKVEIEVVSAPSGIEFIESAEQSEATVPAVLEVVAARHAEVDAIVIAAFSDPGLPEARAIAACPVLGIAESAMRAAASRTDRFVIVTLGAALLDVIERNAARSGYAAQLAAVRILPWPLAEVAADPDHFREAFRQECARAMRDDGAGAVIIGGGPLAGIAEAVAPDIGIPVLDGVRCAVATAQGRTGS